MRRRDGHTSEGFSLLELLIAVTILAVILLPVMTSLHTSMQGTERLSEESFAANMGLSLLEQLSQVPYTYLPEVPEDTPEAEIGTYFPDPAVIPGVIAPDPNFKRLFDIRRVSLRTESPGMAGNSKWGNLKRIRVAVRWNPSYLDEKSERTILLQTLVTDDRDLQ